MPSKMRRFDALSVSRALKRLGYEVSELVDRDYGQTEFFLTDDHGYSHLLRCSGEDVEHTLRRNAHWYMSGSVYQALAQIFGFRSEPIG